MFYLLLITFFVFVIFWLGDLLIMIKTVKHLGRGVEFNPLLRAIFRFRGRFIYAFKLVEIGAFSYLIWFLSTFEGEIPFYILLFFIFFYGLLVANNAHVYYKATNKESSIFKLIYVGLLVALVSFIYLNYLLFLDIGTLNNALLQSNEDYVELYDESQKKFQEHNETIESTTPEEQLSALDDLNLPIRRVFN